MWMLVNFVKCWLNLEKNVISSMKCVRYNNLFIKILNLVGSGIIGSFSMLSLQPGSTEVEVDLAARSLDYCNNSELYFLWHKVTPLEDLVISKPKKYLRFLRALMLNLVFNSYLIWEILMRLSQRDYFLQE